MSEEEQYIEAHLVGYGMESKVLCFLLSRLTAAEAENGRLMDTVTRQGTKPGDVVRYLPAFNQSKKEKQEKSAKKCVQCSTLISHEGKFCQECAWCYKCEWGGRHYKKNPIDMIEVTGGWPVCKDCK
jgi:uncharacterized paraquat-inducible protein A